MPTVAAIAGIASVEAIRRWRTRSIRRRRMQATTVPRGGRGGPVRCEGAPPYATAPNATEVSVAPAGSASAAAAPGALRRDDVTAVAVHSAQGVPVRGRARGPGSEELAAVPAFRACAGT
jgi:hypothetical protein